MYTYVHVYMHMYYMTVCGGGVSQEKAGGGGDGLRLTKLEVARVLRERNEYKEKYLSLLEQVRYPLTLTASSCSVYMYNVHHNMHGTCTCTCICMHMYYNVHVQCTTMYMYNVSHTILHLSCIILCNIMFMCIYNVYIMYYTCTL